MKKVAIIADGWKKNISYAWISGCKQYIKESNQDICIHVFNSFGNFSKDEKYNAGEYNIMNLPRLEEYDGILLELTNVFVEEIYDNILKRVRESGVPAVSLVRDVPGVYYSGINNYNAMYGIVEHLVKHHGVRKLNYVGGPEENDENQERLRAYKDVLKKYEIPVEEQRIIHNTFDLSTGEAAFHYFKEKNLIPEAFVCANDNIAVGLCHEAKLDGYVVPQDFFVTGFDNFDKASYYDPRITTVGVIREEIAYNALDMLVRFWNGEKVDSYVHAKTEWVFQDSCGCIPQKTADRGEYVTHHIFQEERNSCIQNTLLELKRLLLNCESFMDIKDRISDNVEMLNIESLYIMMNESIAHCDKMSQVDKNAMSEYITDGYPDRMELVFASGENTSKIKKNLLTGRLLPDEEKEKTGDVFLFLSLHFRDQEVGYIVMKNCDEIMDNQTVFEILNVFQDSMEYMYHHIILNRMNRELSKLYMMDSLTGTYNRMAYNHKAIPLFENCMRCKKPMMVMFVDVNRLKLINDTYGHDMGNVAIKTLASALMQTISMEGIVIRYGGDEFVALVPDCDAKAAEDLVIQLNTCIERLAEAAKAEFEISASIGYVIANDTARNLNDYINMADEKMYEAKKLRK